MLTDPRETLSCCLFQVKFTVLFEAFVLEALPTLSTHKGFFSGVDSLVSFGVSTSHVRSTHRASHPCGFAGAGRGLRNH